MPRDHWLEKWEKEAIVKFFHEQPLEGYRRLCFMMLDRDIVAVSPATVYRVLKAEGLLANRWSKPSRKGTGFVQPLVPHDHWHIDFSYVNVGGTFYYLCSILDGCSRSIVHWEIRESMKESDAELVLQRARERFPQARPQIICENGPQFVAKDFKEFIRQWQTTHVLTSPYYPQSNGKIERWHQTLKNKVLLENYFLPGDLEAQIKAFIEHYNHQRYHERESPEQGAAADFATDELLQPQRRGNRPRQKNGFRTAGSEWSGYHSRRQQPVNRFRFQMGSV